MKKCTAALLSAAAAGGLFYAVHDSVFKGLIDRSFEMPEFIQNILEGTDKAEREKEEEYCKGRLKWLVSYGYEKHYIINDRGQKLVGYLMKPEKESNVYVFGSHGYRSSGKGEWCHYAQHYVEDLGYNMFFVDHQAAGESEGQYYGFASYESRDSLRWLRYMNETFGEDIEIILHGISMGSATVMLMSADEALAPNVKFTIADCGFTSAYDEFSHSLKSMKIPVFPVLTTVAAINRKKAGYDFRKDTDALSAVKKARVPMLFIHGGADDFVPTYMGHQLYEACEAEYKDLLIVEGADHAKSYRVGKEAYEQKIAEFTEKFIQAK